MYKYIGEMGAALLLRSGTKFSIAGGRLSTAAYQPGPE